MPDESATPNPIDAIANMMDMLLALTEPVSGACRGLRDAGVPEGSIEAFATLTLTKMVELFFARGES